MKKQWISVKCGLSRDPKHRQAMGRLSNLIRDFSIPKGETMTEQQADYIIKPIETSYRGYRFRSRLEARWAIFFDTLNIDWEYEKEGYKLPSGWYLPDFWINTVNMFAEVKPGQFSDKEKSLTAELAWISKFPVLRLDGTPQNRPYFAVHQEGELMDYCLTNYHNYPQEEHRFYCCPSDYESYWDDTQSAIDAALSARFEHGEHGEHGEQVR